MIVLRWEGNKFVQVGSHENTWKMEGSRATGRWEFGTSEIQLNSDGRTFKGTFRGTDSGNTWGGKVVGTKLDDH